MVTPCLFVLPRIDGAEAACPSRTADDSRIGFGAPHLRRRAACGDRCQLVTVSLGAACREMDEMAPANRRRSVDRSMDVDPLRAGRRRGHFSLPRHLAAADWRGSPSAAAPRGHSNWRWCTRRCSGFGFRVDGAAGHLVRPFCAADRLVVRLLAPRARGARARCAAGAASPPFDVAWCVLRLARRRRPHDEAAGADGDRRYLLRIGSRWNGDESWNYRLYPKVRLRLRFTPPRHPRCHGVLDFSPWRRRRMQRRRRASRRTAGGPPARASKSSASSANEHRRKEHFCSAPRRVVDGFAALMIRLPRSVAAADGKASRSPSDAPTLRLSRSSTSYHAVDSARRRRGFAAARRAGTLRGRAAAGWPTPSWRRRRRCVPWWAPRRRRGGLPSRTTRRPLRPACRRRVRWCRRPPGEHLRHPVSLPRGPASAAGARLRAGAASSTTAAAPGGGQRPAILW